MFRALRSTLATNASSQTIRAACARVHVEAGVVAHRAGQEVDGQVEPGAGGDELLHLLVRLAPAELGVDVDQREVGDVDPERAAELADDDLGHQRLRALAGRGELHDVRAEVVGLDEPGQRAALPQRRQVGGGVDVRELRRRSVVEGAHPCPGVASVAQASSTGA